MPRLSDGHLLAVTSSVAWCTDVVVITHSPAIAGELRSRVEDVSTDNTRNTLRLQLGVLSTPRDNKPYRLAIGQLASGDEDTNSIVEDILERFDPRYIVLLDQPTKIGNKVAAGDVAVARLLWEHRY